jgi:hypothetical protein
LRTPKIPTQRQVISDLKHSAALVGKLYPVLVDKHGKIIDGRCRLEADPNWPRVEVKSVDSEKGRLLARIISNVCRRDVSSTEKTEMLRELGHICLGQGIHPGGLVKEISEKTGMSYRWVMKYIPDDLKMRPGLGGPKKLESFYKSKINLYESKVAPFATDEYELFLEPQERVAKLAHYSNTNFVTIVVEKQFYLKLKAAVAELDANLDVIINNALLLTLQKVEKWAKQKSTPVMICTSK